MFRSGVPKKTRSWLGCLNNYTEVELEQLKAETCRYCALGFHVGEKSKLPHVHIDMEFKNPCVRPKFNPRIHWEPRRGTLQQALDYLNKEDKLEERGDKPRVTANGGGAEQVWASFIDGIHAGDVDKDSMLYARFSSYAEKRMADLKPRRTYNGELPSKNLWLRGKTGCGKSRLASEYCAEPYLKAKNKWWDNYHGEKVVIMDDVDPSTFSFANSVGNFKTWADRYSFPAEFKGGSRVVNAADFELIITSQYSIDQCFNYEDSQAIHRRFDYWDMTPDEPSTWPGSH